MVIFHSYVKLPEGNNKIAIACGHPPRSAARPWIHPGLRSRTGETGFDGHVAADAGFNMVYPPEK